MVEDYCEIDEEWQREQYMLRNRPPSGLSKFTSYMKRRLIDDVANRVSASTPTHAVKSGFNTHNSGLNTPNIDASFNNRLNGPNVNRIGGKKSKSPQKSKSHKRYFQKI